MESKHPTPTPPAFTVPTCEIGKESNLLDINPCNPEFMKWTLLWSSELKGLKILSLRNSEVLMSNYLDKLTLLL